MDISKLPCTRCRSCLPFRVSSATLSQPSPYRAVQQKPSIHFIWKKHQYISSDGEGSPGGGEKCCIYCKTRLKIRPKMHCTNLKCQLVRMQEMLAHLKTRMAIYRFLYFKQQSHQDSSLSRKLYCGAFLFININNPVKVPQIPISFLHHHLFIICCQNCHLIFSSSFWRQFLRKT